MFKKIIWMSISMVLIPSIINAQSNWQLVGPISANRQNGNGFETGQMTDIITDPNALGHLFAASVFGGLWESTDNGINWVQIDMRSTGTNQTRAIAFKNANELLVGNYHGATKAKGSGFGFYDYNVVYPNRVSAYNFTNQTWNHYPVIPTTLNYLINCVAVHPANQNVIYAGTTIGLFRFDGIVWQQVVRDCHIESIVFLNTTDCYISGSDIPTYNKSSPTGFSMVKYSNDAGNLMFTTSIILNTPVPVGQPGIVESHTKICKGNSSIYALTLGVTNQENRYLHAITGIASSLMHNWTDNGGYNRMPLIYDQLHNWLWTGAMKLECYDITNGPPLNSGIQAGFHTGSGLVHDDIHGFSIDTNNNLWVACDGGICQGDLTAITNPAGIYFNGKNNKLNVSLINGFSGSHLTPNLYAVGCQDIVNTDIYDEVLQKNIYTHGTWENDGAFIYKYDDMHMFFDYMSYNGIIYHSTNKGVSLGPSVGYYNPKTTYPFQADLTNPNSGYYFEFAYQRVIQDPFRPQRVFAIGESHHPSLYQFDFNANAFVLRTNFYTNGFNNSIWYQFISDVSFSPQTIQSMHILFSSKSFTGYQAASEIAKYIGPDIEDSWFNHNEHWTGTPWASAPQWSFITPDYTNFSSIGGGAVNITNANDLGKINFVGIETSPWNKEMVYVAGNVDDVGPNAAIKVLKYNGSTWSDYSTGIPSNAVVTNFAMDYMSNDGLYLTTELGAYYRDATMNTWIPFDNNFPMADVAQMEINYNENTVRVGTYGMGIWKSQLYCPNLMSINHTGTINSNIYEANTIVSAGIMGMTGTPTAYRGTSSVTLMPGFSVTGSSTANNWFYAYIHGCNTPGSSFKQGQGENKPFWFSDLKPQDVKMLQVYPNPAKDLLTAVYKLFEEQTGHMDLCDLTGRVIQTTQLAAHTAQTTFDVSQLENGTYVVHFYNGENLLETQKVIVAK